MAGKLPVAVVGTTALPLLVVGGIAVDAGASFAGTGLGAWSAAWRLRICSVVGGLRGAFI
jgi:hypothetical protein